MFSVCTSQLSHAYHTCLAHFIVPHLLDKNSFILDNTSRICMILNSDQQPGQLSGIALGYGLDNRGFEYRQGLGIFLFTTASRPALGPTQPPIQWVPGDLSLRVKRQRREADHSPPSIAKVKEYLELYLHSPSTPSWRCAQLKRKAQGQFYTYFYFYLDSDQCQCERPVRLLNVRREML
jgi:hypothetical protein